MKLKRHLLTVVLLTGLAAGIQSARAEDHDMNKMGAQTNAVVKPYPLKTCLVSGEKLGGDMGKPITLIHQGQEMKFCCKDCVKDFKKNPEKWMKKLAEEQVKAAAEKK